MPKIKEDLKRQAMVLSAYCESQGWQYELIEDIGSGINYNKRGWRRFKSFRIFAIALSKSSRKSRKHPLFNCN